MKNSCRSAHADDPMRRPVLSKRIRGSGVLFGLLVACVAAAGPIEAQAQDDRAGPGLGEEIVFIAPSRTGKAIHAVRPDGSSHREIFSIPEYADETATIWELSASPDGARIAFASNHDWDRSLNLVNVYVVNADGANLKRPSNPPSLPQLAAYETGKVRVGAERLVRGGALSAYVTGAREPVTTDLREGQAHQFVVEAADLGSGVRQQVRIFDNNPGSSNRCRFDPAVSADVKSGQSVDAGEMPMLGPLTCPSVWSPGWIDNERLAVLAAEPHAVSSPHNIWVVDANIQPGESGERWLDTSRMSGSNKLTRVFAGEAEGDTPTIVAFRSGAIATGLLASSVDDPDAMQIGSVSVCGTTTCKATSVDATPDGELTIMTAHATDTFGPDYSAIFLSRGDDGPFEQILKLENEVIGTAAISPDGSQIVFDRAKTLIDTYERVFSGERPQCPCTIWKVDADGSGLSKLVDDGRAPDWSR